MNRRFIFLQCTLAIFTAGGVGASLLAGCSQVTAPENSTPRASAYVSTPQSADENRAPILPDARLTPGDVLDVTPQDFCQSGYSKKVRHVTAALKRQVFTEYGISNPAKGEYEVDHLISLELGGSNSIKNLWPESYRTVWNARVKDVLENRLHKMICSGQIDAKTAQREIASDWIAAYKKYVGARPKVSKRRTE